MDPFSVTVGALTLIGVLIHTANAARNTIETLTDAPEELQSLAEEADQIRAVLEDVVEASQPFSSTAISTSDAITAVSSLIPSTQSVTSATPNSLSTQVGQARLYLEQLKRLTDELIISDGLGQAKVNRAGWLRKRKEARKLQKKLHELKLNFTTLLISRTLSRLSALENTLNQAEAQSLARHNTMARLLSQMLRQNSFMSYQLSRIEVPRIYSVPHLHRNTPVLLLQQGSTSSQIPAGNERNQVPSGFIESTELDHRNDSISQGDSASTNSSPNHFPCPPVRASFESNIDLDEHCSCESERPRMISTPVMLSSFTGRWTIGVTGVTSRGPPCASLSCKTRSRWSWVVSYYFPSKLLARAIIFKCVKTPLGDPSIGIYTRGILPDHSSLLQAAERDDVGEIKALFEKRHNTPNDMEPMGFSALTCAISHDSVKACRFLLKAGADSSLQDSFGISAIDFAWLAAFEDRLAPATLTFLRNDSRFFLRDRDHPEFVDIVEKYQFSKIHRQVLGLLPNSELETGLAETPASVVNRTDAQGKTPLLWASRRGDETSVRLLLQHGANPNISDTMRRSPLHMACRAKSLPVIKMLLKWGADAGASNFINEMPAHYACYEEDSSRLLQPLVDMGIDVNAPSKFGRTLLDIVVQIDFSVATQYLLERGAVAAGVASNDWPMRPLGRAIRYKAHRSVRVLLRSGCDEGFIDSQGQNVLHLVAQHGNLDTVDCMRVLRLATDYTDSRDKEGRSPSDVAKLRENDETFQRAFLDWVDDIREAEYPENYVDALS